MGLFLLLNVAHYSQALPIVVFFSSVMSVLYYLGVMQWVITKVKVTQSSFVSIQPVRPLEYVLHMAVSFCVKISWVMQLTMGTSSTETLSVAGNIFVGQVIFHFMSSFTLRKAFTGAVPFQKVLICTL